MDKATLEELKARARVLAQRHIPLGTCIQCGTTKNVHRHHTDYSEPLKVQMLCASHHRHAHNKRKRNVINKRTMRNMQLTMPDGMTVTDLQWLQAIR